MEFVQARHDVVRSVTHRWLVKCWGKLQNGNRVPLWKTLEIEDIASFVDKLMFCDVVHQDGEAQFRIRYQGKRITELYGVDCRGRLLGSTMTPGQREVTLAVYRETVQARCPAYTIVNMIDRNNNPVSYERLLLPFSFDGQRVSRILAALELVSSEGGFAREGLMIAPPVAEYALCATIHTVPA
jgi:hypothetical protein